MRREYRRTRPPCHTRDGRTAGRRKEAFAGARANLRADARLAPDTSKVSTMLFDQVALAVCQSYLVGCADTCSAALIDPS